MKNKEGEGFMSYVGVEVMLARRRLRCRRPPTAECRIKLHGFSLNQMDGALYSREGRSTLAQSSSISRLNSTAEF